MPHIIHAEEVADLCEHAIDIATYSATSPYLRTIASSRGESLSSFQAPNKNPASNSSSASISEMDYPQKPAFVYPEGLAFQEINTDIISSICLLGKRILRQYSSEFILPDNTRVAVSRRETTYPAEATHSVLVSLAVGLPRLNASDKYGGKEDEKGGQSQSKPQVETACEEGYNTKQTSEIDANGACGEGTALANSSIHNKRTSVVSNSMITETNMTNEATSSWLGTSEYEDEVEEAFCEECE
ncbi:unnamed protein product, partial [Protopolystoma xenopodis]